MLCDDDNDEVELELIYIDETELMVDELADVILSLVLAINDEFEKNEIIDEIGYEHIVVGEVDDEVEVELDDLEYGIC